MASAGCRKIDGVPVDASVADSFCAMIPAFPIPAVTTRPGSARIASTVRRKSSPIRSSSWRTASASVSMIALASGIRGSIRVVAAAPRTAW